MDEIDINFSTQPHHNRQQVLKKYTTSIWKLRSLAEQTYHVRPLYFDNFVQFQYFQRSDRNVANNKSKQTQRTTLHPHLALFKSLLDRRRQIMYWIFYLSLLLFGVLAFRNDASMNVAGRHIRHIVYPSMRIWRRITLPLIRQFPQLTEFHDETCLMENPFFQTEDHSCRHCANIPSVLDLTAKDEVMQSNSEKENFFEQIKVPFIFKLNQNPIQLDDFYEIYNQNKKVFQRDAYRVYSTNKHVTNLEELFVEFNESIAHEDSTIEMKTKHPTHNLWRCNRMHPARVLRKIFSRPDRLPSTGLALERFIAIDSALAPSYALPVTECANVVIQQALGTRFIILRPTSECRHRCRTLSIRLSQSYILSYNWWYWKPISTPDPLAETIAISLIGSYC